MSSKNTIYVVGCGAVGFPLVALLTYTGRRAVAVRTSRDDVSNATITVTVRTGENPISARVETTSLVALTSLDGIIVITAKAHANQTIAAQLRDKAASGPIVIMQNGVGVERPFVDAHFPEVHRCILYVTSQAIPGDGFDFRAVTSSPVGIVQGTEAGLGECIDTLTTDAFPLHPEPDIQREIWKKAIINSVFNSVCTLLEIDNGVFARDEAIATLARDIVAECVTLTKRLPIDLAESELMTQIMQISQRSDGQFISTLQDIRRGKPTEIGFLNLEIARVAAAMRPEAEVPKVELLGKLVLAKSLQRSNESQ